MLFRIVVVPKLVGNFLLMVNVIPGTLGALHERCREQGLDTTYVHHLCYKPSIISKKNSMVIPYARAEKPTDKLCLGHLPVIKIIPWTESDMMMPESAGIREELFSLHRDASFISSTGTNIELTLADDWPQNPNTALPSGAGKLPVCPKEVDSCAGKRPLIHNSWIYVVSTRCKNHIKSGRNP